MRRPFLILSSIVLSVILTGCGGGGGGGSGPPAQPQLVAALSPSSLSFGSTGVGSTSPAQTLTLTNNSTPTLNISSITATGPFSQTNNCPASLNANAACTINVTFSPSAIGSAAGSIAVVDNASNSPQTASLSGAATAGFVMTGSMTTGRYLHTATLLNNGTVLIAGGLNGSGDAVASAELYDLETGKFSATGSMTTTRYRHTSTLLNNGQVLVTGGEFSGTGPASSLASAELYDPATGSFTATGSMSSARVFHTARVLNNGKVLIAGGLFASASGNTFLASAQLYDPTTRTFSATGSLNNAREEHTATLLNDGNVLIAGGNDGAGGSGGFVSAEVYDPTTGIFTITGNPNTARSGHTAALLNNGEVLIAAGYVPGGNMLASAELYDPTTGTFTYTGSMTTAREYQRASMLNNGVVFITGGLSNVPALISDAELYDPASGIFTFGGSMLGATYWHTSTLLNNGNVLLTGGNSLTPSLCELYLSGLVAPAELVSITVTPSTPTLSPGVAQQFIATGTFSGNSTQTLQSVIWSSSNMAAATISNDASNHGVALAAADGTSTITATTGSISGSAVLTVR